MSNRVSVELSVLPEHAAVTEVLFDYAPSDRYTSDDGLLQVYTFDEIDFGTLPFLKGLKQAGIPYDTTYHAGTTFPGGKEGIRFNAEGWPWRYKFDDMHEDRVPATDLVGLIEHGASLVEVMQYAQSYVKATTVPSWEGQLENAALYLSKFDV